MKRKYFFEGKEQKQYKVKNVQKMKILKREYQNNVELEKKKKKFQR